MVRIHVGQPEWQHGENMSEEFSLKKEYELLVSLSDAIPTPVFYKNADLTYIGCNKAFEDFFQKDRKELLGTTILDLYADFFEKAQGLHKRDQDFLKSSDEQYIYESDIADKDGQIHNFIITKGKFYHPDGSLGGIVAVMFDHTEKRSAQNELQEEKRFFQILIDSVPSLLFYKDTQLKYLGCNKAFENYLKVDRKSLVGKTALDVHSSEIAHPIFDREQSFLSSNDEKIEHEKKLPDGSTGEIRDFVIAKGKFYKSSGELQGIVANMFDITERNRLESDLRKTKDEVESLYKNLLSANEQLKSGIQYASQIQRGILLEKEAFKDLFPNSFIFFQPKDIVSGDFYWFARKEDVVFVAAVDCTGHGVPGALMTVLGHSFLDQIIYEQNVLQPNIILSMLESKLQKSLQKKDPSQQINDGMELSLAAVDLRNGKLHFSGAKSFLWHIRNGKLNSIRGSRWAIGGRVSQKEKKFDLHELSLEKGDAFYFSTDGFWDQIRKEDHRRLMRKQFESLLLEIHELPMEQQEAKLRETWKNWCGDFIQTDDILVMGLKID